MYHWTFFMDSPRQGMYHREAAFVNARALSLFFQSFSYQTVFFESDIFSFGNAGKYGPSGNKPFFPSNGDFLGHDTYGV
jgi:hypothetical protein